MSVTCPRCNTVNNEGTAFCISCGYSLEGIVPSAPTPPPPPTYANQPQGNFSANAPVMIERRYGVLRAISTLFNVLAWIFLVISVLGGVGAAIAYGGGEGFLMVLGGILSGGLMFVMFKSYAELLHLAIDIEENTRRTAESFKRR